MSTNRHPHSHFWPHKQLELVEELVLQALQVERAVQALLADSVEGLDLVASLQKDWLVVVGYLVLSALKMAWQSPSDSQWSHSWNNYPR